MDSDNTFSQERSHTGTSGGIREGTSWKTSNLSQQIDLREEVGNIESIAVVKSEDTMRFDKETILYVIEYYIRGKKFATKRSYSEFLHLWKEVNYCYSLI